MARVNQRHTSVSVAEPTSAMGEITTITPAPSVQLDPTYGALSTDVETLTQTGGSATATGTLFTVTTGTSVGGYGVIRSRRFVRHRPGEGTQYRVVASFTTGVALGFQLAGAFSATEALGFGYNGATFGIFIRSPGALAIHRLTVSVGTAGVETITITLNGTAFTVASGGALSTSATAELIAERVGGYTGWSSTVSPQSNGSTVTFIQTTPGATSGDFTMTSTGTAAGTFATLQAGIANDDNVYFVPQTQWNVDRCDGSGYNWNPSGFVIDPTKLNVYEVASADNGLSIQFKVMDFDGHWMTVHQQRAVNNRTAPPMKNQTMRLGWIAASLGSTTDLTVKGSSASGFVDGARTSTRDPFAVAVQTTASVTEYVAVAVRSRGEFNSLANQRLVLPQTLRTTIDTANRSVTLRIYMNPTMTGTVNWQYVNQGLSAIEYATPTSITPSGGQLMATSSAATGSTDRLDLAPLDIRMEPGDVMVITVQAASSTAVTNVGINWQEI